MREKERKEREMRAEITVRRPGGSIETVDVTDKFPRGLNDYYFGIIAKQTAAAGRGQVIGYRNNEPTSTPLTDSDYRTHCERCHEVVDMRTAKGRPSRAGALKITAYYCDNCYRYLRIMGQI